jgi:hypothetical protein
MTDMNMADALQAEQRTVSSAGEVFIEGRTWVAPELMEHVNRRVHLVLDVVDGHLVVRVYSLAGQYICKAELVTYEQLVNPSCKPLHERLARLMTTGATQ